MIRALLFDLAGTLVELLPGGRAVACEGAVECLRQLRGRYRLAIVTNETGLTTEQVRRLAHQAGIPVDFDVVASPGVAGASKPAPQIFTWTLEQLGCTADAAVMIGDGYETDICGAKAAGLRTVWLNPLGRGRGFRTACEDREITSLAELPVVLESLEPS